MAKEMFKVGDRILLPDTTLKAVPADTDGAGELVCDDGKGHKCYFLKTGKCPKGEKICTNGYQGVIFIEI